MYDPNVRASDADREAFGERLRRHHAEGRLDAEEFQDRIDRCYKAKSIGELRELVTDLPREDHDAGRSFRFRWLWPIPVVPVLLIIAAVSIGSWHHHGAWGLLWLIPVLLLIRFCVWRRVRRWDAWRDYGTL